MTETELTAKILELAQKRGVFAHHCPDSRRCEGYPGFPDLVLAGPHGVIFAELKSATGIEDDYQIGWAKTLIQSMVFEPGIKHACVLWRPDDLISGRVEHLINEIA